MGSSSNMPGLSGAEFAATRWNVVLAAGDASNPQFHEALAELCRNYWRPLYAFIRRRGYTSTDAKDLTQEFFARLLTKNFLSDADPDKGRFRSYLLGALKHFLADQHDRTMARKRGGGAVIIAIDAEPEEGRAKFEPVDENTAEKLFDRQWALQTIERSMAALEKEFSAAGKARLFAVLRQALTPGNDDRSYREMAAALGTTEGNVKVAVHRLRRRYRELMREIIAQTLADTNDVEDEIQHLFSALS